MLSGTRVDMVGEATMAAQYYGADSENGDRIDEPSEEALFKPRSPQKATKPRRIRTMLPVETPRTE